MIAPESRSRGQHGWTSAKLFDSAVRLVDWQVGAVKGEEDFTVVVTATVPPWLKLAVLLQQSPNRLNSAVVQLERPQLFPMPSRSPSSDAWYRLPSEISTMTNCPPE